ncbi:MAG TPA: DEAD/DEAH box helicase [Thermoanaerobaculia bacterium]|jgi:DEAD/DEAH box helicase domain-containing protein|nr:DEAD/DEAH box helicase [Thermoanaerobaculia bacterium]
MQPPEASSPAAVVEALRRHPRLAPQLAHVLRLPSQPAAFGDLELPPALAAALAAAGAPRLWSHQATGLAALRRGEHVLVTTPTASGKSLVFHLPVLAEAARGGPGRALFLFPLKALGQDQRGKLAALAAAAGLDADCAVYDGDASPALRARLRRRPPRVLITNPDMLHLGILPSWLTWAPFLADLRWIVLDELHTYRGIFGSHVHHVLQRLRRICRELGGNPQLIASSATAENADAFATALAGVPFTRVATSGAPRAERHFLLVQPSSSPYTTTLALLVELLRQGQKTIVFTKARRITELLYRWLRQQEPALAARVASYRAGFLPEERRRIERELLEGRLQGVISTSALELGIDVGGLDACMLVGWPGSVMAAWQRSGRVGRQGRESITALVALPDALDQWLVRHPEELLGRPCEPLVVDPQNPVVARQHLPCAAAEMPLERAADREHLERHAGAVSALLDEHELRASDDGERLYARRPRPHRAVSLRGGGETFAIVEAGSGRVVGTIDGLRVFFECHPGAIYLHAGRQYLVRELDLGGARAVVEPAAVDWYTAALAQKDTRILEVSGERHAGPLSAWLGRLRVTERVVGYERKRIFGGEVLSRHQLELPEVAWETMGFWWAATPDLELALTKDGRPHHFLGSLHAAEHTAIALLPLLALCDRGDLGGISTPFHPQVGCGAVFVYEGHAGGVGIAARAFAALPELLGRVGRLLAECPCEDGCPSCVQSPKCGNGNRPLDKAGARRTVGWLLGEEPLPALLAAAPPWQLRLGEAEPAPASTASEDRDSPATEEREEPAPGATVSTRNGNGAAPAPLVMPVAGNGHAPLVVPPLARLRVTIAALWRSWWRRAPALAPVPLLPPPAPGGGTVLFDLETLRSAAEVGGWGNAHRMGIALAVLCHLEEERFEVFREGEARALAAALRGARLVIGFNVRRFDYRVLGGYTGADYNRLVPTLDLLEEIHRALGFRLRLDALARATLGVGKSADGLQSLAWVREGRLDLVEAYCRRDVEVLRDLYLFGRREGYVLWHDREDRRLRLPVRW